MVRVTTSGINFAGILGIVAVCILLVVYILWPRNPFPGSEVVVSDQERRSIVDDSLLPFEEEVVEEEVIVPGQYRDFFAGDLENLSGSKRIVLFFDGRNCSTCIVLHEDINRNRRNIPEDLIIFRVPFNSSLELRNRYAVSEPGVLVYIDSSSQEVLRTWKNSVTLDAIVAVVR